MASDRHRRNDTMAVFAAPYIINVKPVRRNKNKKKKHAQLRPDSVSRLRASHRFTGEIRATQCSWDAGWNASRHYADGYDTCVGLISGEVTAMTAARTGREKNIINHKRALDRCDAGFLRGHTSFCYNIRSSCRQELMNGPFPLVHYYYFFSVLGVKGGKYLIIIIHTHTCYLHSRRMKCAVCCNIVSNKFSGP